MARLIIQTVGLASLIAIQSSFGEGIFFFRAFSLMLLVVIFVSAVSSWPVAVLSSAAGGLALDAVSYMPLGYYLTAAILTCLIIRSLVKHVFTSLSLLSMAAISILATIFYWTFIFITSNLLIAANIIDFKPVASAGALKLAAIQIAVHALLIGLLFFLLSRLSQRFNLAFLKK